MPTTRTVTLMLLAITGLAVVLYLGVLGYLWFRQENLLFYPQPLPPD